MTAIDSYGSRSAVFFYARFSRLSMEYRASGHEFRIRDKQAGIVEARVNQLEVVDSYNSIFADGIWDRAIARDGRMPKILVDHDGRRAGRVTETRQVRERNGLFQVATMQYNLRSQYGSEAFEDVADGTDDEYSVGFLTTEKKYVKVDGEPVERKLEARWFEVSQVLAGASPGTGTISVRSELEALVAPAYTDLAAFLDYRAVAVKDGAKSPPAGYPEDSSKYGDPDHYKYPLDTDTRIHAAVAYYNHSGQREAGGYNAEEWSSVGRRIIAAANKAFGGGYSLDGETIATAGSRAVPHEETLEEVIGEERAGKAISAANQKQLQGAHDALAGLPGVMCHADNVTASDNDGDETYSMAQILEEARSGLTTLGIESKG